MGKHRILSFDGGGIRLALAARLLKRLHEQVPELIEKADLFIGTSSGSYIALALACGIQPNEIDKQLFSETFWRGIFTDPNYPYNQPKYDSLRVRQALKTFFPNGLKLKDVQRKVIAVSFREKGPHSRSWAPAFFTNYKFFKTDDTTVIDAAEASSAFPIFFPSFQHPLNQLSYIDGAVIGNNPGLTGITFAVDRKAENKNLKDVVLLSFGWGYYPLRINQNTENWGVLQWTINPQLVKNELKAHEPVFPLPELVLNGQMETHTYYCDQLLGDRFYRLNPVLSRPVNIDDVDSISYLKSLADRVDLTETLQFIKKYWTTYS